MPGDKRTLALKLTHHQGKVEAIGMYIELAEEKHFPVELKLTYQVAVS